jgi:hypothetical protein
LALVVFIPPTSDQSSLISAGKSIRIGGDFQKMPENSKGFH